MTISKIQKKQLIKDIELAVKVAVELQINGNLRDIKSHLTQQDLKIEELNKKIRPISTTRNYLINTGKVILYLGGIALAIVAIIRLIHMK
jgi:hypothetical protein